MLLPSGNMGKKPTIIKDKDATIPSTNNIL